MIKSRGLSLLTLFCFCAATLPLPLPSLEIIHKADTQPFPCQNSTCGCKTARQCWTSCCCRSPEQRLAWGEKNGVTPPKYAVRHSSTNPTAGNTFAGKSSAGKASAASDRTLTVNAVSASKTKSPAKPCCVPGKSANAGTTAATNLHKAICGSSPSNDACCSEEQTVSSKENSENRSSKTQITLSIMALKCQGKSTAFTLLPWTILSSPLQVAKFDPTVGLLLVPHRELAASIFYQPDTPPPKRMLS